MVQIDLDAPIAKFMRPTIYSITGEDTCVNAAKVMKTHGVGSVFVKEKEEIVGILTERDILNRVIGEGLDPSKVKAHDVMSFPLMTIDSDAKVHEALEIMAMHDFRRLPVVQDGKVVGLLAQRFMIHEELRELLEKASRPAIESVRLHAFYRGKIEVSLKVPVRTFNDFALWYTPGVSQPCKDIAKDKNKVFDYTNKWNNIAIVSDGTRVLGLGDIGPEAGLPVMEGKALLFKYLGGVDAFPICLSTKDPDKIIEIVKEIQPSFGAINLEDISQPKCFYILDKLRSEAEIPVWHDDQQGTATVILAGTENALKIVGKKPKDVLVTLVGAGAANIRVAWLLIAAGFNPGNIILVDSKGVLNQARKDLTGFPQKSELAKVTNQEQRTGGIKEAMKSADVMIAAATSTPGLIQRDWVKDMASDAIVFACANPQPEIWPWDAKEAGARIVATGRSDFPNQVNNSLGFPGIFRGVLDVRAKKITDPMCIAAAHEMAKVAEDQGMNEDYILPRMDNFEVFWREAVAIGIEAQEEGLALLKVSREQLTEDAKKIITRSREMTHTSTLAGLIRNPDPEIRLVAAGE
ncbi:MAG TPA: malic enzyme-like NAD(P)-binding protein [Candidatus Bathyarchaeia archaeon]|nr:malic enzyme-like NAD(P)-binding protein [Candidatus Bathyarchaeia archaeon]